MGSRSNGFDRDFLAIVLSAMPIYSRYQGFRIIGFFLSLVAELYFGAWGNDMQSDIQNSVLDFVQRFVDDIGHFFSSGYKTI